MFDLTDHTANRRKMSSVEIGTLEIQPASSHEADTKKDDVVTQHIKGRTDLINQPLDAADNKVFAQVVESEYATLTKSQVFRKFYKVSTVATTAYGRPPLIRTPPLVGQPHTIFAASSKKQLLCICII